MIGKEAKDCVTTLVERKTGLARGSAIALQRNASTESRKCCTSNLKSDVVFDLGTVRGQASPNEEKLVRVAAE